MKVHTVAPFNFTMFAFFCKKWHQTLLKWWEGEKHTKHAVVAFKCNLTFISFKWLINAATLMRIDDSKHRYWCARLQHVLFLLEIEIENYHHTKSLCHQQQWFKIQVKKNIKYHFFDIEHKRTWICYRNWNRNMIETKYM